MKIAILSRSSKVASTKRLLEAARERGHHARVLNPARLELELSRKKSRLSLERKTIHPPDVLIPRVAHSVAAWGLALVEQFELSGAKVMNSAKAIGQSQNALRCLQLLASKGVDIPATVVARATGNLEEMVDQVGGMPVLVKLIKSHEHGAVLVCETMQSLESSLEAVLGLKQTLLLQEFVDAKNDDLRVFCVGGRALAAARRNRKKRKLAEKIALTPELSEAAERAAKVCELEVCAVDVLETKGRFKVFDVNATPALPLIEKICQVDLASAIIARAEQLSKPPLRAVHD
ncbi:MAG: RimK family alpha-L-glutamate ligase [Myxococcaceae bacterium]